MSLMRKNHVNKKTSIIRYRTDSSPGQVRQPTQLLVYREGMVMKVSDSDKKDGYTIRVCESPNPIVTTNTSNVYQAAPWSVQPAYGKHFELVADQSKDVNVSQQWINILVAGQDVAVSLYDRSRVGYVAIFADRVRYDRVPCLQIATFTDIPSSINEEIKATSEVRRDLGKCYMCHMISADSKERHIIESKNFVAFCPWSPSFPYEFWIAPKKHTSFVSLSQKELKDLAFILQVSLRSLARVLEDATCSLAFRFSSEKKKDSWNLHWHIEVYPGAPVSLGMSQGFGISLCDVSPEDVAKKLGAVGRAEFAAMVGV